MRRTVVGSVVRVVWAAAAAAAATAAAAAAGNDDRVCGKQGEDSIFGFNGLSEYQPGSARMILSAPHGGYAAHPGVPDRQHGCYLNDTDACAFEGDPACASPGVKKCRIINRGDRYTIELSLIAADEVERILGKRPHLIFSHLQRRKLDPNREVDQAAQGNRVAEAAYRDFHGFIRRARRAVGRGILFDMHGQCAGYNTTMLGYRVNKEALNSEDFGAAANSSVRALFERLNRGDASMSGEELLAGQAGLGALFEAEGYMAVPSPRQPWPGKQAYYRGGYITLTYGSIDGADEVDAIQIETPGELKNDVDESVRRRFGRAMGRAFAEFYRRYYEDDEPGESGESNELMEEEEEEEEEEEKEEEESSSEDEKDEDSSSEE